MTDIVAVHGAFRGGWSWDLVARSLAGSGHRLWAPKLRGMGDGRRAPVTLDDWIDDVAAVIETHDLSDIVLCGHSMGGVVAQAAIGRIGHRVNRLVLIDSPLIAAGQRPVDVSGPTVPDPSALPPRQTWLPPSPVGAEQGFVDPELAAWVNERLCATPFGPQLDRCPDLGRAAVLTDLVFCDLTPDGFPSTFTRRSCDHDGITYRLLDCHHDAPLLAPRAVAEILSGSGSPATVERHVP